MTLRSWWTRASALAALLLFGASCGEENVEVLVTVDVVAGPTPTTTYHWIKVDGIYERSYAFGDTLRYSLEPGMHTFQFYMVAPNCIVTPPGPTEVEIRGEDAPVMVTFEYACTTYTAPFPKGDGREAGRTQ